MANKDFTIEGVNYSVAATLAHGSKEKFTKWAMAVHHEGRPDDKRAEIFSRAWDKAVELGGEPKKAEPPKK